MKYRIIAAVSVLIGTFQTITALSQLLVSTKLNSIYQDFGVDAAPPTVVINLLTLALGALNLFLGWKVASSHDSQKERLVIPALLTAVVSIVTVSLFTALAQMVMISPIYNLTQ